jgi:hypothetical protein
MKGNHLFEEDGLRAADVFNRLAGHRLRQKADEVAGMPCLHRHADFAVRLEAADARTVAGAGIDNDKRPGLGIDLHAFRRDDTHQDIIDRPFECPAVGNHVERIVEDVRRELGAVLPVLISALAQRVPE